MIQTMAAVATLPLSKPAEASYPIHDLIAARWSPRAFTDRPVEETKLRSLFEAARWAASSGNQQPWRFLFATREDAAAHARFVGVLWERNQRWAKDAPVLVLVVAKLYDRPGSESRSFYDVGMAAANLVIQAVDLGLVTHQMGGFSAEKARELLGVPEGYEPLAMIALGYPGDPGTLPEDLRERELAPRSRTPQEAFAYAGHWPEPAVSSNG
jgi:nitroreductase